MAASLDDGDGLEAALRGVGDERRAIRHGPVKGTIMGESTLTLHDAMRRRRGWRAHDREGGQREERGGYGEGRTRSLRWRQRRRAWARRRRTWRGSAGRRSGRGCRGRWPAVRTAHRMSARRERKVSLRVFRGGGGTHGFLHFCAREGDAVLVWVGQRREVAQAVFLHPPRLLVSALAHAFTLSHERGNSPRAIPARADPSL